MRCLLRPSIALLSLLSLGGVLAHADTVTDISFSYGGGSLNPPGAWATQINGGSIIAAPKTGNTGTGITFADWSGSFNEIDNGVSRTFTFQPVPLNSLGEVHTLLSTFYGSSSLQATVTFTNDAGATASFGLVGDQTIRDYNNNVFTDDLLGYNTAAGLGAVTAENWWANGQGQRLDVQTFVLPASWAGTDLTSMAISDPANSGGVDILSALQVVDVTPSPASVTPEPGSLCLLATGSLAFFGLARRKATAASAG